jgi:hypothetical protein
MIQQLRDMGFEPANERSSGSLEGRWKLREPEVILDILLSAPDDVSPSAQASAPAQRAALAFRDRIPVSLSGATLLGEQADATIWTCGPGAFVLIKALLFDGRHGPKTAKDAYDLFYVLRLRRRHRRRCGTCCAVAHVAAGPTRQANSGRTFRSSGRCGAAGGSQVLAWNEPSPDPGRRRGVREAIAINPWI